MAALYDVLVLLLLCALWEISSLGIVAGQTAVLTVDASPQSAKKIPDTMFGIFFEELNHAGTGGLWAELVSNRGFEAGGPNTPSNIGPWFIIGNQSNIVVSTDKTSCFSRNIVALRMDVLCGAGGNACPSGGVGIGNPGYWGMNIESGKIYNVVLHLRSSDSVNLSVSLMSSDGMQTIASHTISADKKNVVSWKKFEFQLKSAGADVSASLQLTTNKGGVVWLDQISVMPMETYKGHGYRSDLFSMLANLNPRFLKFPGGSYARGTMVQNSFRWKSTVGPWEERPGHWNDVWNYWTDDGLGLFEFLQLAEDLGASPVWVVNNGIAINNEVPITTIAAFVKDILDGIEFARGRANSKWGSVRAAMGHPKPFQLKHVSIGNQECFAYNYKENYYKFYSAIKAAYPDVNIVSNCDGSSSPLDHPADLYDVHMYTSAADMFSKSRLFDTSPRNGPKAFISEYAVTGNDAGKGTLLAALAEAGFLMGLERNSDVVAMASSAPLFLNDNNRGFIPDAIVFNSARYYGCPNYWMQHFFKDSSGASLHPSVIQVKNYDANVMLASTTTWQSSQDKNTYLKIKVLNYGSKVVNFNIAVAGLQNEIKSWGSMKTVLTSASLYDENSFQQPDKVVPVTSPITNASTQMNIVLDAYSLTSFDLLLDSTHSSM